MKNFEANKIYLRIPTKITTLACCVQLSSQMEKLSVWTRRQWQLTNLQRAINEWMHHKKSRSHSPSFILICVRRDSHIQFKTITNWQNQIHSELKTIPIWHVIACSLSLSFSRFVMKTFTYWHYPPVSMPSDIALIYFFFFRKVQLWTQETKEKTHLKVYRFTHFSII